MVRKGQFYLLDAFFAAAILFLGITLILSDYVNVPDQAQTQIASIDSSALLFNTPLGEIDNNYTREHYNITDETLSPIQQVRLWLYNETQGCTWCASNATALVDSIVGDLLPLQHGINVSIKNGTPEETTVVYYRGTLQIPDYLVVSKQVLITPLNDTVSLGPDIAEVQIWR